MKKEKKFKVSVWTFVLMVALGASIFGVNTAGAADKVYTIRLAEFYAAPPGGGGLPKAGAWWANEVKKRTGGKVKVETGWAQAFGTVAEMPDLVRTGAVQMAALAPGYYAKQMPLWNVLSAMPFVTYDPEVTCRVTWELYDTFPAMKEELVKNNIKILYIGVLNPYKYLSAKPIKTLEDMNGLKIRSWGTMIPRALKLVGAVPVSISVADAYDAFSRGTIDVQVGPADMIVGQGWHELGKNLTNVDFTSPLAACGAINLDYWNSLPPHIQKVMVEVGREHEQVIIKLLKEEEKKALNTMEQKGIALIPFAEQKAKWVKMSPDFLNEWADQMESKGLPGKEFVKRYNDIMKKIGKN
jgi:TRAP-type C4-dicarboxylate transport system substrate-binding protein